MISLDRIIALIVLLWVFLYTVSFGRWTWKRNNKLGAVMLFITALAVLILPVYTIFF